MIRNDTQTAFRLHVTVGGEFLEGDGGPTGGRPIISGPDKKRAQGKFSALFFVCSGQSPISRCSSRITKMPDR